MEKVYERPVHFYDDSFVCIDLRYLNDWYGHDMWYINVYVDRRFHQRWELTKYATTNEAIDAARLVAESFRNRGLRTRVRVKSVKPEDRRLRHLKEQYGEAC